MKLTPREAVLVAGLVLASVLDVLLASQIGKYRDLQDCANRQSITALDVAEKHWKRAESLLAAGGPSDRVCIVTLNGGDEIEALLMPDGKWVESARARRESTWQLIAPDSHVEASGTYLPPLTNCQDIFWLGEPSAKQIVKP